MTQLKFFIDRFRQWTQHHPLWAVFIAGILCGAALPPVYFWPGLFGFSVLMTVLIQSPSLKQTFLRAWLFGFGFNLVSLTWIVWALHVDWAAFWWMVPFALLGPGALMAVSMALAAIPTYWTRGRTIWTVLVFGAVWGAIEYVRFFIFPWNFLSTMLVFSLPLMQLFAWVQVNILSTFLVWTGCVPFLFYAIECRWLRVWTVIKTIVFWALCWTLGLCRLSDAPSVKDAAMTRVAYLSGDMISDRVGDIPEGVPFIRVVQPAVPQIDKWKVDAAKGHIDQMIQLSTLPLSTTPPAVVVWPESAMTVFLSHQKQMRIYIAQALAPHAFLMTGGLRLDSTSNLPRIWNSQFTLDAHGEIVDIYDKRHLLLFGEYLPGRVILEKLPISWGSFLQSSVDYTPGENTPERHVPGFGVCKVNICYEIAFPERSTLRPDWILHTTNDGWFGKSAGPYQHLALARIRAVESGLPVVRAANTGISALIDAYGRVLTSLPLDQPGILDCTLPKALSEAPSIWGIFQKPAADRATDLEKKRLELVAYLQENPNDVAGWAFLAQIYSTLGYGQEAAIAAARAEVLTPIKGKKAVIANLA